MCILLLWQCFFVTRWLEEGRLHLLALVVMVRSDIALLGTGVMKNVASSFSLSSSDPVTYLNVHGDCVPYCSRLSWSK